jgi:methionyl-tRNA formyltransferase
MIVVCVGYRDWARDIYKGLVDDCLDKFYIFDELSYKEEDMNRISPDLILYYGWSSIISEKIINNFLCLMLHPSPLPKYRGGSPLQNQIIRGEKKSAVTIFKMTNSLDDGPILAQTPLSLEGSLNSIFSRIIKIGISDTKKILKGEYSLIEQDHKKSTYFKRLTPDKSEISVKDIQTKTSEYLYNKIRMLSDPYPSAYIRTSDGKKLLIKVVEICDE